MRPAPSDLQRWSDELARNPASLAFIPLAQAYRRFGQRDAAVKLCLRGLERHPNHVEAHTLLARLYLESGERDKACDEWSTILRWDADNFDAHRGLGFFALERGELAAAERHLRAAAAQRPDDPAVREALALVGSRMQQRGEPEAIPAAPAAPVAAAAPMEVRGAASPAKAQGRAPGPAEPGKVFDSLRGDALFRWAMIVDRQGLVLASTSAIDGGEAELEMVAAVFGGAIDEALRSVDLLELGGWKGILLEASEATIHITAIGEGLMVMLAAMRGAPVGWVMRTAHRAADLGRAYAGVPA